MIVNVQTAVGVTVVCCAGMLGIVRSSEFQVVKRRNLWRSKLSNYTFYATCDCDCRKYCYLTPNCTAVTARRSTKGVVTCQPTNVDRPYMYLEYDLNDDLGTTRTYILTDWRQWFWSYPVTDLKNDSLTKACNDGGGLPFNLATEDDYENLQYFVRGGHEKGSAIAVYGSANPTCFNGEPLYSHLKEKYIIGDPVWGECFLLYWNRTLEHAGCNVKQPRPVLCHYYKDT